MTQKLRTLEGDVEVTVHSYLEGPIEKLSFLRKSLLFAELANIAYFSRVDAGWLAFQVGLPETRFYNNDGAQAFLFANRTDAVITFRGTEPNEWSDIRADLNAGRALFGSAGHVHRGFKREVDNIWPRLELALGNNRRNLWFTGHSLGGAMATICAGSCKLSSIPSNPEALFTFGSPRVGNRRYVNFLELQHYRWVNNNDCVPRFPPALLSYRHCGEEVYLDMCGEVRRMNRFQRMTDRWRGIFSALMNGQFDPFADHKIDRYISAIANLLAESEGLVRFVRPLPDSSETSIPTVRPISLRRQKEAAFDREFKRAA